MLRERCFCVSPKNFLLECLNIYNIRSFRCVLGGQSCDNRRARERSVKGNAGSSCCAYESVRLRNERICRTLHALVGGKENYECCEFELTILVVRKVHSVFVVDRSSRSARLSLSARKGRRETTPVVWPKKKRASFISREIFRRPTSPGRPLPLPGS